MSEIIFEITEDGTEGGNSAASIGYGIHTQADPSRESAARCGKLWTHTLTRLWSGLASFACTSSALNSCFRETAPQRRRIEISIASGQLSRSRNDSPTLSNRSPRRSSRSLRASSIGCVRHSRAPTNRRRQINPQQRLNLTQLLRGYPLQEKSHQVILTRLSKYHAVDRE